MTDQVTSTTNCVVGALVDATDKEEMDSVCRYFVWYTIHCDSLDTVKCLLTHLVITSQNRLRPLSPDDAYGIQCLQLLQHIRPEMDMSTLIDRVANEILYHRLLHKNKRCGPGGQNCFICQSIDTSFFHIARYPAISHDDIFLSL